MIDQEKIQALNLKVSENRANIIQFLRDIVAIPSMDSQIGPVGERIAEEMNKLGFDEVRFDVMGNIFGKIGSGEKVMVFDSHIDTVGIGDPDEWTHDPFEGKIENGIFYGRGACDEKNSTPGMVYGLAFARDLGLLEGWTVYYFGNMEEWCDGIAPNSFVEVDPKVRPDFVVIGEPTKMNVYRGHKGRLELKVTAKGRTAHAASNHLGDNPIYALLPVIAGIRDLEPELGDHSFLGNGKITVSDLVVQTPSINAVPGEAVIFIDRRMTFGETKEGVTAQIEALIPQDYKDRVKIEALFYEEPSYTGFVFPVDKYFPAWALDENHPLVEAGLEVRSLMGLPDAAAGKWNFSTNGIYWAGKANIPSIGFGPGDEETAHTINDSVPIDDMVNATLFYALIPSVLKDKI